MRRKTQRRITQYDSIHRSFVKGPAVTGGMAGRSLKPVHYPITPEIHTAIEKVYHRDSGNGQVAALAKRLEYPRWKISRYAIQQGWIAKQRKEPDWSERELKIMEHHAHLSPEVIQRKLKAQGFSRSTTGIVLKRKRMRMLNNLDGMSATSFAECLGVDSHFVTRAIQAGRLKAEYRGTKRTAIQGGDMFYIRRKDIRRYIVDYLNEIDIRKCDKYYLVDLLTTKD